MAMTDPDREQQLTSEEKAAIKDAVKKFLRPYLRWVFGTNLLGLIALGAWVIFKLPATVVDIGKGELESANSPLQKSLDRHGRM